MREGTEETTNVLRVHMTERINEELSAEYLYDIAIISDHFVIKQTHAKKLGSRNNRPWYWLRLPVPMASQYDPVTRSRTGLFLSYRDSRATSTRFSKQKLSRYADNDGDNDEQDRLIGSSSHVTLDVDLPPKWYARVYGSCGHTLLTST